MSTPDFTVSGGGSVYLLTPITQEANDWVDTHLGGDVQRLGNGIAVEHRYIGDVVIGIRNDGLAVI